MVGQGRQKTDLPHVSREFNKGGMPVAASEKDESNRLVRRVCQACRLYDVLKSLLDTLIASVENDDLVTSPPVSRSDILGRLVRQLTEVRPIPYDGHASRVQTELAKGEFSESIMDDDDVV